MPLYLDVHFQSRGRPWIKDLFLYGGVLLFGGGVYPLRGRYRIGVASAVRKDPVGSLDSRLGGFGVRLPGGPTGGGVDKALPKYWKREILLESDVQ